MPDPQSGGPPHIRGEIDNKLQAHGQLQTTDKLSFNIACEVVDIRPNGNLVLEGHRSIKNNEEVWEFLLSGETRPESIKPNEHASSARTSRPCGSTSARRGTSATAIARAGR